MSDITCAKCSEPWDAYGVRNGDMEEHEATRFLKGEGCPSCHFGTCCPLCSGTGKVSSSYGVKECCTDGTRVAWSPSRSGFGYKAGEWHVGYSPNVQHVPEPKLLRRLDSVPSNDGMVRQHVIQCPTCNGVGEHLEPCGRCTGTGKLDVDPERELEAARSHLDASDEEPIGLLIARGLI